MTKEECLQNINSKELVIRGAGKIGTEFYEKYGHVFNIKLCTSNKRGECINGLNRIEFDEIKKNRGDYFNIICSCDYEAIAFQLLSEGLRFGEDYISYDLFIALVEQKKVFLAVGQCELDVTDYIYKNMSSLKNAIQFFYYDEYKVLGIEDKRPLLQNIIEVNSIVEMADYFVYPVNLTMRCKYYENLIERTKKNCIIASVPLSTFEGYWPQDNTKNYYEKAAYYLTAYSLRFRRDMNIEEAFKNGKEEDILEKIVKEDFYDEATVSKCFEKTIKKFEILERKTDVTISDYYKEHYKTKKLFLDRGHAAPFVLKVYAKRILESCGITFEVKEIEQMDLTWYEECHLEFPIYPSVRKRLNLADDEKYRIIQNEKIFYLDFESYMQIIYGYVKKGRMYLGEEQDEKNSMYSK